MTDNAVVLAIATFLMVVITYIRKFDAVSKLPSKYVPYGSIILSVFVCVTQQTISAIQANHTWWMAALTGLIEGVVVGLAASGSWSALGKYVIPVQKIVVDAGILPAPLPVEPAATEEKPTEPNKE